MGLLDEAIREHLELKRLRGADAGEISREETEALGPVRRSPDGTPDLASMLPQPVADPSHHDDPTGAETEPDWDDETTIHAPLPATPTPGDHAPAPVPQDYAEPVGTPAPPDDAAPPATPSPAAPAPRDYAQPAHEPQPATAPPPVHALPPAHPPAAFDEAFDDDAPLAPLDDEPLPQAPRGKRRLGGLLRRRSADPDPAPEPAPQAFDDLDPPTAAHATPPPPLAPYQPPPTAPPTAPAHGEPAGEDLLEETPEFLEETPDHDRLWFEQRPPRDFDFDG